jgi:hypothetical protein
MFNFGISKESAVKTTKQQLKPWNIYEVTFQGCEIREFPGVKDPSKTYKVLDIKFSNDEGYFTVTKFFPKEGDDVRREVAGKNGGKRELASNFEELMNIVKQTAEILTPEGFKKMSEASSKFKSFDDVAKALKTVTDKVIGKSTKIKLIGRNRNNKIVAEIPNITSVFDGEAAITDNYIGDKLFFSDYEEGKRAEYLNSKPTNMQTVKSSQEDLIEQPQEEEDPLNLDDLL